ncbi:MAG: PAS domain S-box protein [Balneolaceae bacterium]|nr:PAS domain S-box protein [Balneolaceae bacterium]
MNQEIRTSFSNRFKAKLALQAVEGRPIKELSEEYGVPGKEIEAWAEKLRKQAEFVFLDQGEAADITDLKKQGVEQSFGVKDYASLLSATFEAIPGGVMVIDLEGRVVTYNQECMDMWDIPHEVVATGEIEKAMEYVMQQLKEPLKFKKNVQELYNNPELESRYRLEFEDGRVFERYSIPHRLGGEIVGRVTSFIDVTDRVKAEQKAHEYGDLLDSITTNVSEGILRSTPEEGLIYVNDAFVEMFGYDSREEAMSTNPERYYADKEKRGKWLEKLKKEGRIRNEEVLFQRKDGSTFWGLENSTIVEKDYNVFIDGVVNDISEMKLAEEALRESEEKYRSILRNIEEGYFETDLEGNFTFFNRSLADTLGYDPIDMYGMNNRDYMDEENAQKVFAAFNKVYKTGMPEQGFDWVLINKEGERIIVEASVNLIKSDEGEPIGFRGIIRDVTERKNREKQIRKSLKEKEILLGEIHHRVKNNLAVISGLLYLQSEKTDEPLAQDLLKQSQNRINSMGIVHELLYKNQTFASIDPANYIEQLTEHVLKNQNLGDKDIETSIDAKNLQLDMNLAIPCALIINELLTNAYKYAFEGRSSGRIEVSMTRQDDTYKLLVKDDGVGFDEEALEDDEKGLGLFLVKTLTKQIRGELDITTSDGSSFKITFPTR